jgi:hypothetical protein
LPLRVKETESSLPKFQEIASLTTIRRKITEASEEKGETDQGTKQEQSELQRTMTDSQVRAVRLGVHKNKG